MSTDFEAKTEEARETAAERKAHYFLAEQLYPFSLGRQLAVQRIGTTNSELENALLLVFLCSTDADTIDRLTRDPVGIAEFRGLMEKWGDDKGLSIMSTVGGEYVGNSKLLVEVANSIWDETTASHFKPKETTGSTTPADPNASGRGSRRSTPRKSRQ